MAAAWTNCEEFVDEPCRIYKELYLTKDLGKTWTFMQDYVFDFAWAASKAGNNLNDEENEEIKQIPSGRILVTHDPSAKGH